MPQISELSHYFVHHRVKGLTYSDAGVNINAGNQFVKAIRPLAAATSRSGCSAELGGFGGFFDLKAAGFQDPILVSGTDGVGTKLKVLNSNSRLHSDSATFSTRGEGIPF